MVRTPTQGRRERAPSTCLRFQPTPTTRLLADFNRRVRQLRPQLNREYANERENALHLAANMAQLRRRLAGRKTTQVGPDLDLMDRDIFQEIQRSLAIGLRVRLSRRSGAAVIRRRYPVHLPTWERIHSNDVSQLLSGIRDKILWVPPWKSTGPRLKLLSWCMALQDTGKTFNLHLTQEVIDQARSHKRGFAYAIQQRMMRSLRKEMSRVGLQAPDFFFVVEATEGIEEHLHGVIELGDDPRVRKVIRKVMLSAAGYDDDRKLTGTELRMKAITYAPGWAEYVLKWTYQSSLALDDSIIAATNGLRKRGENWYRNARDHDWQIEPKCVGMELMEMAERGLID